MEQILIDFFFSIQRIFPFVSWTSKYAIYKFSFKKPEIEF